MFKRALLWGLVVAAPAFASCTKGSDHKAGPQPFEVLEAAFTPAAAVAALRRCKGAHFHGTTTWRISSPGSGPTIRGGDPAQENAVTTTTDLWIDAAGQFRMLETNDRDGGREVVLHGHELSVGLRYGKMIRRPAQEPEPTRLLEEAVGGPSAAWEIMRRFATVESSPAGGNSFTVRLAPSPAEPIAPSTDVPPLKKWRETVNIDRLTGEVLLASKNTMALTLSLAAHFTATRDHEPVGGDITVTATVDNIGAAAPIEPPIAEELRFRQRTTLEEKALLGPGP